MERFSRARKTNGVDTIEYHVTHVILHIHIWSVRVIVHGLCAALDV
jgi:hypothetical protein